MNLAFSIKNWKSPAFTDYCNYAAESKISGIIIDSVFNPIFEGKGSPISPDSARGTVRQMQKQKLSIPCIDTTCDFVDDDSEVSKAIKTAKNLSVDHVMVHTYENDRDKVISALKMIVRYAESSGIELLIESSGYFADTSKLRDALNEFASDNLAACWNMHDTFFNGGEDAETTITNLGAYVKLVILSDASVSDGNMTHELIGEGQLPMTELMNALRSVNYKGYIALEWDSAWIEGLDDLEIILTHFEDYMSKFDSTARAKKHLYKNNRNTGEFIWKKETLIYKTFSQVLDAQCEEFPDQIAFHYTTLDYTRTYSQFRDDVDNCARALVSMGVKAGTHVAVWATNLPQWYIAFWAVTKIGAVLVSMNTAYKIHEAEYLLRQSDTHTLILIDGYRDSNYAQIINELCPEIKSKKKTDPLHAKRLPFLRNVITVGFEQEGCMTWDEAMELADHTPVEEVYRLASYVSPDDVCNMQYTSGTTGFPKGVMLTHYNVVNNGKCIGDRMDLSTEDRMMIQVPMFHCFGMVLSMTASMTHGSSIYPMPYFSAKPSLACIHQERITCFNGVPTMFISLLEHPDFDKTDFSYMRTGIMAGSPCPISVMKDVVEKMNMREITIVFGQTEASPGCTMSSTDDPLEVRVSTVGRPLPEIECKIIDPETGEDLPDEATGEFVARGYNIMKGYYKMPRATASTIDKDGWLHTGDLACRTPEGNYRITGRLKDMIIRGGENIYPKEIEEFIYTHPKVSDVQVIGVPDEALGEEIMACVILKEGQQMTDAEMKTYVRDHMAKHKVPKYVDFIESFPMNAAGKILKYKMREDAIVKLGLQDAASVETA